MKFSYFTSKQGSLLTRISRGVTAGLCTVAPLGNGSAWSGVANEPTW